LEIGMAKLGVNIDHVATVRQARRTDEPDPVWAAVEAELGGADGITFHLREDRRHINDRDARLLKETVAVKLNMEMSIADEIVAIAVDLRPDQCTLVPERREELTTEGGLDVIRHKARVEAAVRRLRDAGIVVSAFIEPIPDQVRASADAGFHAVELWTGSYAHANDDAERKEALLHLRSAIDVGEKAGLEVHGGHGLTYRNIAAIASVPGFCEFNIGQSIVSRSVFVGMREAVREMKHLLRLHRPE
jgi:pyridoxine 5-phosphate synthase